MDWRLACQADAAGSVVPKWSLGVDCPVLRERRQCETDVQIAVIQR
jgi:hypothetical protein